MLDLVNVGATVEHAGFAIVPQVINATQGAQLSTALAAVAANASEQRRGGMYALRHLLEAVPQARAVAAAPTVRSLVEPLLGPDGFVARSLLLDKTETANWKVAWHQDLSVAVRARKAAAGFSAWSEKAGVWHVQPPVEVLTRMLTVRLYLDNCDATNGPLRVLPGSHNAGRLNAAGIRDWRERVAPVTCHVPRGGALVMRPLLLHASSVAQTPGHRRVIQLEFAAHELPAGLEWFSRHAPAR